MSEVSALPLVLIEWLDSHAGRGWQTIDRLSLAATPLYCHSVGWLLSQSDECAVLVPHFGGERNGDQMMQGCGDLVIPAKAIVKVSALKHASRLAKRRAKTPKE